MGFTAGYHRFDEREKREEKKNASRSIADEANWRGTRAYPNRYRKVRANESYELLQLSISLKLFGLGIFPTIQQLAMLDGNFYETFK